MANVKSGKLSVAQKNIVRSMRSGARLAWSSWRSRMLIAATRNVGEITIKALVRKGLIVRKENNPFTEYVLTELGKFIEL